MFRSYLKASFKHLINNKLYTSINLLSLILGITACFLVVLSIAEVLGYDRFHKNLNRIYLLNLRSVTRDRYHNGSPALLGPQLSGIAPEIVDFVRFAWMETGLVHYKDKEFFNCNFEFADPSVFDVFTFEFIRGNKKNALTDPNSIILTSATSKKIFGQENPVGKAITVGKYCPKDYMVTGVIKDLPEKSSIHFDGLCSFINVKETRWGIRNFPTYLLLDPKCHPKDVEEKIRVLAKQYLAPEDPSSLELVLQPMRDVHLNLGLFNKVPSTVQSTTIYLYGLVGLIILFIACINFINLTSAQVIKRQKEGWIRKVLGAQNSQLTIYLLIETLALFLFAFASSIIVTALVLPTFNRLSGSDIQFRFFHSMGVLLFVLGFIFFFGIISGLYPSMIVRTLSNQNKVGGVWSKNTSFHKSMVNTFLIVFQLAAAILFIGITFLINRQIRFVTNKDLGFEKEGIIVLPVHKQKVKSKINILQSEINGMPDVLSIAATSYLPGIQEFNQNLNTDILDLDKLGRISWISVDQSFIETMAINIIEGRNFIKYSAQDEQSGYILNQAAIKALGWEQPIGMQFGIPDIYENGYVIGVIGDFHFKNLHEVIKPLALCIYPSEYRFLYIKLQPESMQTSIASIKAKWEEIIKDEPFEFIFLDQDLYGLYKPEIQTRRIFNVLSFTAIVIACLGIFGISLLSITNRTKEIGIRKVNGATAFDVLVMFYKSYLKILGIAFIIACPIIYYYISTWLDNFAYRLDISWYLIFLSGIITLILVLLSVSWQSLQAASKNPTETLRYE